MSTTQSEIIVSSDISVTTAYAGNRTGTIEVGFNSSVGLGFKIDAGAGATELIFKVQTLINAVWTDLYRDDGTGLFELEEYRIPINASTNDQLRAIRLACDGIRDMRLDFKSLGGTATINTIHILREAARING